MLSEHGGHVDRLVLRTQTNSSAGELTQIERRLHMASLDGSGTWTGRTLEPPCRLRCVSCSTRVTGTSALRPGDRVCDPVEKKRVARANHHGTPRSTT